MKFNFLQRRRLTQSMGKKIVDTLEKGQPISLKEAKSEQESQQVNPNIVAVMNLVLMKDGGVKSSCQWLPTMEASKAFGEFLFCLHSGKMKHSTIGMLSDLAESDMAAKDLVAAIFDRWQELVVLEEDRPLILPHEALRMGQNPEEE